MSLALEGCRIPEHIKEDFVQDVDGFFYYWPKGSNGHFAAHHLRRIADELDKMNAEWDQHLKDYFNSA